MVKYSKKLQAATQNESREYVKTLTLAFEKHEKKTISKSQCRKLGMNKKEFLQHYRRKNYFIDGAEDDDTYNEIKKKLIQNDLATLRATVLAACKRKNKTKISTIQQCALALAPKLFWIPKSFKASRSWAHSIKMQIDPSSRQKNKNQAIEVYIMNEIEKFGEVEAKRVQLKCNALYGVKTYTQWESYSRRLKKKLKLISKPKDIGEHQPVWIKFKKIN